MRVAGLVTDGDGRLLAFGAPSNGNKDAEMIADFLLCAGHEVQVAYDASQAAAPEMARRLRLLARVNGAMGLIAAGLLLARLGGLF